MQMWKLFLSLSVLISGCSITVPSTKVCMVAGLMVAGADCVETLSEKKSTMTFDEFVTFLEPTDLRAGALCQSAEDWTKQKTAIQQLCKKLGNMCDYETQKTIEQVSARVDGLQRKVSAKKKKGAK